MFAEQNFPVLEVSSYLIDLDIPQKKLEKFCHFNDGFYTRNLVHKERDFEILVVCWPAGKRPLFMVTKVKNVGLELKVVRFKFVITNKSL